MLIKSDLRLLNDENEVNVSVFKNVHQLIRFTIISLNFFETFREVRRRTLFQFQFFKNTCTYPTKQNT